MNQVGELHIDHNEQFRHKNLTVVEYTSHRNSAISVDCKKRKHWQIKNNGSEYPPNKHPVKTLGHGFPLLDRGKVVSYGVYDIINNEGYVDVGASKGSRFRLCKTELQEFSNEIKLKTSPPNDLKSTPDTLILLGFLHIFIITELVEGFSESQTLIDWDVSCKMGR